jgi:hypothetical protein
MGHVDWKLRDYLKEKNIKPRELENEVLRLGHTFGRNSIYRLIKDDGPTNLNRDTLAVLIDALRSLTKRKVKVSDLVEYQEE